MRRFLLAEVLVVCCALPCTARAADKARTIDLGGLRRAQVEVRLRGSDYVVRARMLPVGCFDAATNARVNRDKAEQYALQGLARYLSRAKAVQFEVSGARVAETGRDGPFYTLTLKVPRAGVKEVRAAPEKPDEKPDQGPGGHGKRLTFSDSFFTRKRDYLHTLERLAAGLVADLGAAERRADKDRKQQDGFLLAVAELEERGEDNFKKLRAEVSGDRLLFAVEKDEILRDLGLRRARWLKLLGDAARRHEERKPENPA